MHNMRINLIGVVAILCPLAKAVQEFPMSYGPTHRFHPWHEPLDQAL